jgi:large subunit ribosomal protein L25
LPAHVPQQINADVHGLVSLEDELRAGQLELPEGVSLVADPDLVIAAVVPSRMAEVEEAIAVEEAPSAAETQAEVAAEAEPEAES